MKKGIFFFAAALMMSSCVDQLTVDSPKAEMDGAAVVMVFEAAPEAQVDTRTSLSGDVVSWTVADRISVFAGMENAPFELKEINADGTGVFEGTAVEADSYYALYPYSAAATITEAGVISTSLPCEQKGVAGTFDNGLNIAVAEVSGGKFTMMNVCGLVKFDIVRSDIAAVSLFGNGHEYLAGDVDIAFGEDGKPSYTVTNGTKYVTLTPKEGKTFAPGTYYFTILPQTLKGGMSLVYMTEAQSGTVATASDAVVARSAYLTIKANPESALQLNKVIDLSDPDGDGTSETANCYVAGLAGRRYCFPATIMGNGYTTPADDSYTSSLNGSSPELAPKPIAPISAKLLWQTERSLIKHVILNNGYIYFTLNGTANDTLVSGNAVLAGIGEDNLPAWSWHIWVTDVDLDTKLQTWTVHPDLAEYSEYQNPQLMDRNLGALTDKLWGECGTNGARGLFYQWGRKDPFPGIDNQSQGSATQVQTYDEQDNPHAAKSKITVDPSDFGWYHKSGTLTDDNIAKYPMVFRLIGNGTYWNPTKHNLWGRPMYAIEDNKLGHKTIYDPCPPGYRVMNPYAWSGITDTWTGGKFANMVDEQGTNLHRVTNMNGTAVNKSDGGLKVLYDGKNIGNISNTGTLSNDGNVLQRVADYGYYWTSSMSYTSAQNGLVNAFDYNTIYLMNNYLKSGENYYSRACRGNAVRCEKIK